MYIKSPFPPLPIQEPQNVFEFLLQRCAGREDHLFTVSEGRKRSLHEFLDRVSLAITALGAPVEEGGLGLKREDGEMVGVIGPVVPVRSCHPKLVTMHPDTICLGLFSSISCTRCTRCPNSTIVVVRDTSRATLSNSPGWSDTYLCLPFHAREHSHSGR
jgi:hypothetical protein